MPLARLTGDEFAVAIRHLQSDADVQNAITNITAAFASPLPDPPPRLLRDLHASASRSSRTTAASPTNCCAPRAWRCTRRKTTGGNRGVDLQRAHACALGGAPRARDRVAARARSRTSCSSSISRRSSWPPAASPASRRWCAGAIPTRGIVPPDEFISGGRGIRPHRAAVRPGDAPGAASRSPSGGRPGCRDLRVAVNVSGAQFEAPGFPDWVFAHLDEAGLPGACLELEITESLLMVGRSRGGARGARGARARRARGHRRLRHGLLVAGLSQALPHRGAEDRPLVRRRPRPRFERRRDLRGHHRHGPPARPQDRRRRRRDHGAAAVPGHARLHAGAGFLHRPAGRGGRDGQAAAHRRERTAIVPVLMPAAQKCIDVPLADYEAEMLLKVAKK